MMEMTYNIKIYEKYIVVDIFRYDYDKTTNRGERMYGGSTGSTSFTYFVDKNYNIRVIQTNMNAPYWNVEYRLIKE